MLAAAVVDGSCSVADAGGATLFCAVKVSFFPWEVSVALSGAVGFGFADSLPVSDVVAPELNSGGLAEELGAGAAGLAESLNRVCLPKTLPALGAVFELSNKVGALEVAVVVVVFEASPNNAVLGAAIAGAVVVDALGVCSNKLGAAETLVGATDCEEDSGKEAEGT